MRLLRKPAEEVGFQLAPMIDMTFLLLVFFMVTTRISKEQVKVDIRLPTASNAVIPTDVSERDIISIGRDGQYFAGATAMSRNALAGHLRKRLADQPPLRIYVRADQETPAAQIKEFMRLAAEAGAIHVIFGSYRD